MANSNFIVQNGLTVGGTIIDATSSNVSLPAGSYVNIGGVPLTMPGGSTSFSTATIAQVNSTNGNITTLVSTNLSTGNAQITGGNMTGISIEGVTTLAATNFSTANAVVTGGSINSTPVGATTASTGSFTTLNAASGLTASTMSAGTIGNTGATLTGTLSTAAQTNVTSLGTLTGLTVSGAAINAASGLVASTVSAGTIGNTGATLTGTLSTAAQTNITSVGTLTGLTVTGATTTANIAAGGITSNGTVQAATVTAATIGNSGATLTGTLSSGAQPNITSLAGVTQLGTASSPVSVLGNLVVGGNLTVTGNSVSIGASTLSITDPIINLNTPSDLTPLTVPTTSDIGIKFHYYDSADNHAFLGRAVDSGYLEYYATGNDTANVFTGTLYGTIKSGGHVITNTTAATSTTTGALTVAGGAGVAGALYAGSAYDNGNRVVTTVNTTAGTGISLSAQTTTGPTTAVTITNSGVTSAVAGTDITVSGATGAVTIGTNSTLATVTGRGATTSTAVTFNGQVNVGASIVPTANVTYNLGSTSAWFSTFYGLATQAKYADLAENYQGDRQYNPGTVLMFGGPAEVTVADADTTRVAGIVSTNPAHLMNGGLTGPTVAAVALQGRVPCQVIGPIQKGDLMVSAGFGYAKANNSAGVGQVIGKALEDYPMQAKGVIEVVVGRF